MCLAIPMRVIVTDGFSARCEARGEQRDVSLLRLQHETIQVGDDLLVHLGLALERISAERAAEVWALYDQILSQLESGDAPPTPASG